MNKRFEINHYNSKKPVTVGIEIKIIFHDAIVFSGKVTKENIDKIQKLVYISDNYIIK